MIKIYFIQIVKVEKVKLLQKIFLIRRRLLPAAILIFSCAIVAAGSTVFAQGSKDTSTTNVEKLPVAESDVPDVEQHYLNILKKNPVDSVALNNLGMLYLQLGKTELAKKYLLNAVKLYPGDYLTHYSLGTFYGYLGDIHEAVTHLIESAELNPKSDETFSALGTFYFRQGKSSDAEKSFSSALKINRGNENALFGMMGVYQANNQIDSALEVGKKLLRINNSYQQLHLVLANLYLLKNNLPEALANANEEQSLYPDEPESYYMLAIIYSKTGSEENYRAMIMKLKELIKTKDSAQPLLDSLFRKK